MTGGHWRVVSRRELLDGSPWLRVWSERVELPDGRVVDDFYSLEMPDYVVVVATAGGLVLVQRGYKHGPRRIGIHLPAGYLEPGESPLAAAQRELLEETGYAADHWAPLGRFAIDGNRGGGEAHLFRARDVRRVAAPASSDLEEVEIVLIPRADVLEALHRGEVPLLSSAAAIALGLGASTS